MKKKIKWILIISICFMCGIDNVLAKTFSSDNVISACGFETLPENVPVITSTLYNLAKIVTPIILIVMGMVDFANAVMSSDEQKMKKNQKKFITRLIAAVIVFLVMAIVQFIFTNVDSGNSGDFNNCMNCLLSNKGCGEARSNKPEGSETSPVKPISKTASDVAGAAAKKLGLEQECEKCYSETDSDKKLNCLNECVCNHYKNQSDCTTKPGNSCTWNGSKCTAKYMVPVDSKS